MFSNKRVIFEISSIAVLNRDDASQPTRLTVVQKGCFHLTLLRVPLALVPLNDGVHSTLAAGKITLLQKFLPGQRPVFNTRTRDSLTLEMRLFAKGRLRTVALTTVGDLLARTEQGLAKVPFEVKIGHKVEKAFVEVAQVSPDLTPNSASVYPLRHRRPPLESPFYTFPPPSEPLSPFRMKQLLDAMLGPSTDNTDWSQPFTLSPAAVPVNTTAPPSGCDALDSSGTASRFTGGVEVSVTQSCSKDARPNDGQNLHLEFPPENSGLPQHHEREDSLHHRTVHLTFQEHPGGEGEAVARYAPQASRQEVGHAFVQLWEEVFGRSSVFG